MFDCSLVDFGSCFELYETEWYMIEDIYKHPLNLWHFDHLIDRSLYFIDFGLMVSKGEKRSYLFYFSLLALVSKCCFCCCL